MSLPGIDAVYVINLDRAPDRMAKTARQCEAQGIPFKRVPAVDGTRVSASTLAKVASPVCQKMCSPSVIGCALSHMRVWRAVLRAGYDRVLVLEDDVQLAPEFRKKLLRALEEVPADFDVLLGGCVFLCNKDRKYHMVAELARHLMPPHWTRKNDTRTWGSVFVPEFFGGTHCYVVSNKGCRKLFKAIPQVTYHIDVTMNHPDIQVYAIEPNIALQDGMMDSSMATFAFPKTIMPIMHSWVDDKNVPMSYYMNVTLLQVGDYGVNYWVMFFFLLGLLRDLGAPFVLGFFLAEIVVGGCVGTAACAYAAGWAFSAGVGWTVHRMARR